MKQTLSVQMDSALKASLELEAKEKGFTDLSKYIRRVLEQHIKRTRGTGNDKRGDNKTL